MRHRSSARAATLVAVLVLAVVSAGAGALPSAAGPVASPSERLTGAAAKRCFGAASRDPRKRCTNRSLARVIEPTPDDAITEPSEPCEPLAGSPVDACAFGVGDDEARGTIALIGDSHATHWRAALNVVAEQQRLRGISITRSGCAFTLAETRGKGGCAGWAQAVLRWLERHPEITGVVTSASTGTRVVPAEGLTPRGTAVAGFQDVWAALPPAIRDVWLIRDVPHMAWDTSLCVDEAIWARTAATTCTRPRREALPVDFGAVAYRLEAPARVHLLDLTSFMCDDARCFAVVGGALVSKDGGHLTRTFSRTMGPYLGRAMASTALPAAKAPAPTPQPTPFWATTP